MADQEVTETMGTAEGYEEPLEATVVRLAALSPLEYARVRKDEAKRLGITQIKALDNAVTAARKNGQDEDDLGLLTTSPWPGEVAGDALLDELVAAFTQYIVMEPNSVMIVALWSVHTYCFEFFQNTPRLHIRSPKRRSGKSRVRDVLACTVAKPILAENLTPAVVFRMTEDRQPTWLVDEIDQWLDLKGELVGIFNSGHAKGGQVHRCVGDEQQIQTFNVYTPLALCGIGKIKTDTLADRSIPIMIRRRLKTEPIKRFRLDRAQKEFEPLRRQIQRWVDDTTFGDPEIPEAIDHDRMIDNWWPLLSIADAAGGDWPERAREIMLRQYRAYDATEDGGWDLLLLKDLKGIFDELGQDRAFTKEILEKLHTMNERPWPEFPNRKTGGTKAITSNQLAYLLKPHEIHSKQMKMEGVNKHGYERSDFEDTWTRYVTPPDTPCQTATPLPSADNKGCQGSGLAKVAATVSQPLPLNPKETAKGSGVAVGTPLSGGMKAYTPDAEDIESERQEREAIQAIDGEAAICVHCGELVGLDEAHVPYNGDRKRHARCYDAHFGFER